MVLARAEPGYYKVIIKLDDGFLTTEYPVDIIVQGNNEKHSNEEEEEFSIEEPDLVYPSFTLSSISSSGIITVDFSKEMSVPANFTDAVNKTVLELRVSLFRKDLESVDNRRRLDESDPLTSFILEWKCLAFTPTHMLIQIQS